MRLCHLCDQVTLKTIGVINGVAIGKCSNCDVRKCRACNGATVPDMFVRSCAAGHNLFRP